jgi:hypothetical protein
VVKKVIKKLDNKKRGGLRQIAHNTGVSHETARKILHDKGYKFSSCKKKLFISEETRKERLKFARRMKKREKDWGKTVFTDETSFWLNRCRPDHQWTQNPLLETGPSKHGPKLHLWGAITARGAISLEIFEENLNAQRYLAILKKKKGEIDALYPDGYVFMQDGSPIHRAGICTDYINEEMPQSLMSPHYPSYSPDLNPIENVWAWLKHQVSIDQPKSIEALKKCIKKHWSCVTEEFLAPYFNSMPDRMDSLIECEGNKIDY